MKGHFRHVRWGACNETPLVLPIWKREVILGFQALFEISIAYVSDKTTFLLHSYCRHTRCVHLRFFLLKRTTTNNTVIKIELWMSLIQPVKERLPLTGVHLF